MDRAGVEGGLSDVARVRAWADALQARLVRRLDQLADINPAIFPEQVIADFANTSKRSAGRERRRAATLAHAPAFAAALGAGEVSVEHVDVLDSATSRLPAGQRAAFVADPDLAAVAARSNPEDFARTVRRRVLRVEADGGLGVFARQRASNRLRWWTDRDSGMVVIHAELDPEKGLIVTSLIGRTPRLANRTQRRALQAMYPTCAIPGCHVRYAHWASG